MWALSRPDVPRLLKFVLAPLWLASARDIGITSKMANCSSQPSEFAPSSSALLAELLPRYLDPEGYAVVLGDKEQAGHLLEKQWGHSAFLRHTCPCDARHLVAYALDLKDRHKHTTLIWFSTLYRVRHSRQDHSQSSCRDSHPVDSRSEIALIGGEDTR